MTIKREYDHTEILKKPYLVPVIVNKDTMACKFVLEAIMSLEFDLLNKHLFGKKKRVIHYSSGPFKWQVGPLQ